MENDSPADLAADNARLRAELERARGSDALEALRQSEEKYRSLYRNTPVMMHSIDRAGRIVSVSEFWLSTLGYEKSEVIGRESVAFLTPESRVYARDVVLPAFFRTGVCRDVAYQFVKKDGDPIDVLLSAIAERDGEGQIARSLAVLIDVTERNRALAALKSSERRYQDLVNGVDGIVWEASADGFRFSFVSRQAERILGFPVARWMDEPGFLLARMHESDRAMVQAAVERAARGERPRLEYRVFARDGREVWLRDELELEQGPPALLRGLMVDVSEQKRASAAMEESERRYREIFQNAGVSLWEEDFSDVKGFLGELAARGVVDLRQHLESHPEDVAEAARRVRVDDVNAETLKLHGARSKQELLGELSKTFLPESYDVFKEELIALEEGRSRFASEAVVQTLQGQRRNILMTIVFPSEGPRNRALVSTLDITERKNLEERLRHSQKMEAVGQLAGGIAHDFNNLLAVILGRSELLLGMIPADPELVAQVELIRETVMHASRLTAHLLAFSRQQVLQPRVADLNEIVADTVDMLRRLIGEDVDIRQSLAKDLDPVRVDPGQIGQVVLNLALNARDAMPEGGRLSIDTYNGDDEHGRSVVLCISDTGHGMDAATSARIFEPFFTTKGPGRGTGLGLATVYGIVKQSGGRIRVESAPAEGATFRIFLPRAPAEVAEPTPARDERAPERGTETVLLAEDETAVRAVTSDVLAQHGYRVLIAADAKQALEIAASHAGPIHLLLSDVVMPDVDGRELANRVRALRPDIRVLFISGYTPDRLDLQGTRLLMKPFLSTSLLLAVRSILEGAVTFPASETALQKNK